VVFCAVIFALNVISTRFFAEGEFWFSLVKVVTIIAFIILGGRRSSASFRCRMAPGAGAAQYHRRRLVPARRSADPDDHGGGELRFLRHRAYRHRGGETENPHKVIPVAIRTTIARLIIFLSAPSSCWRR
jgi:S-methylmethionine transporter